MTQTITISGAGSDLIERLQAGYESRELIDLFGIKFAVVKLSSNIWEGEARGTMIAQEVVVAKPMQATDIDWSKAPEGATHYFAPFFYKAGSKRAYLFDSCWEPSAYNIRQIDRLAVKRPIAAQPWSGDGLPPVGTRCELHISGENWQPCEVIAMDEQDGQPVSVVRYGGGYYGADLSCLRPIKTPAQIAAEEREAATKAMKEIVRRTPQEECPYCTLYDAGLRFPKGDEQ